MHFSPIFRKETRIFQLLQFRSTRNTPFCQDAALLKISRSSKFGELSLEFWLTRMSRAVYFFTKYRMCRIWTVECRVKKGFCTNDLLNNWIFKTNESGQKRVQDGNGFRASFVFITEVNRFANLVGVPDICLMPAGKEWLTTRRWQDAVIVKKKERSRWGRNSQRRKRRWGRREKRGGDAGWQLTCHIIHKSQ